MFCVAPKDARRAPVHAKINPLFECGALGMNRRRAAPKHER